MESFVYRLSPLLGGRREVIATPAIELLRYTLLNNEKEEAEAEKERANIWLNFVAMSLSHPPKGKDSNRDKALKEFEEAFKPKPRFDDVAISTGKGWDEEAIDKLLAEQEGG